MIEKIKKQWRYFLYKRFRKLISEVRVTHTFTEEELKVCRHKEAELEYAKRDTLDQMFTHLVEQNYITVHQSKCPESMKTRTTVRINCYRT